MTNVPPPGRGLLAKFHTDETNKITNARGRGGGKWARLELTEQLHGWSEQAIK